ncbi:hypothetical protein EDI_101600 [Entamoeba dispar SAW760]|uniref:Uncharacterized protein n=1 Tax=Entamoeba dispar (strain ATCC PRA-260 / SAW760) TaxID=370354 RepID=B0EE04_ENTDS|nr:uncharacterized protein EDI_101600 [Entamoeba dispar SAW760]EDR27239.1 hypothetical protein EDI_101600 [Entamoeba dispar SAW760]|eukprot:EDR27239.1 hypothetical protein EDI_101600 [Entamoeba dispar SAW760]
MSCGSNTKLTLTEIKRQSKSFEALQQGMLFALLSNYGYGFRLKRPERMAKKTLQYLTINEVYYNGLPLRFGYSIEDFCERKYQMEQRTEMTTSQLKVVKRRKDLNRTAISFSWLIQLAEQNGISFGKRKTKQAKKTIQLEKIKTVVLPNNLGSYSREQINKIGKAVQKHICSLFDKKEKLLTITPYHQFFINALNLNVQQPSTSTSFGSPKTQIVHEHVSVKPDSFVLKLDYDPIYQDPSFVYTYDY